MPKTKWEGAEDPTIITISLKLEAENFEYALLMWKVDKILIGTPTKEMIGNPSIHIMP